MDNTLFDNLPPPPEHGLQQPASRLARRTDPPPSHKAAERSKAFRDGHKLWIVQALGEAGKPIDTREIARRANLTIEQVDRRMHELRSAEVVRLVDDSGDCSVYELMEQGRYMADSVRK